jgi:hypothetical protein
MSSSRLQSRTGWCWSGAGVSRARAALLLSLALAAGGCGTTMPAPTGGLFGGVIAAISEPEPPKPAVPVDIEADGREAQRPPPLRMYRKDDDPTQPFSPNYGDVPLPPEPNESTEQAPT